MGGTIRDATNATGDTLHATLVRKARISSPGRVADTQNAMTSIRETVPLDVFLRANSIAFHMSANSVEPVGSGIRFDDASY